MSIPQAHLPTYPVDHSWSRGRIELFQDEDGRLIISPNLFDVHIKCSPNKLLTLIDVPSSPGPNAYMMKEPALSSQGMKWTDEAYAAYPYFDKEQRDEFGRPCVRHIKSSENQTEFAKLMKKLFGSSGHKQEYSPFVDHIRAAMSKEMTHRCKERGLRLPNGNEPCSKQDVLDIFKSKEMIHRFKNGEEAEVCNLMMYVVKTLTDEGNIGWLEDAVNQYLKKHSIYAVLAPGVSDGTRRNSLVRIAEKKGTQSIKEELRDNEARYFGAVLDLKDQVHFDTTSYKERLTSGKWKIVTLDPSLVPKSRKQHPFYWIESVSCIDQASQLDASLANAVGAGICLKIPRQELIAKMTRIYKELSTDVECCDAQFDAVESDGHSTDENRVGSQMLGEK